MDTYKEDSIVQGDCLDVMRGLCKQYPGGFADLVYIDPPFNTGRVWTNNNKQEYSFNDRWGEPDAAEVELLRDADPALLGLIEALGRYGVRGTTAYLVYMGLRLVWVHRVLRDTGAIFVHIDTKAVHQVRVLLDCIFGSAQFRSSVVFRKATIQSNAKNFCKIYDSLLYYTKTKKHTFNRIYIPYTEEYIKNKFRYTDAQGAYGLEDMTGHETNTQSFEWRGHHPGERGKGSAWAIPTDRMKALGGENLPAKEKLELLYARGYIVFSKNGIPRYKRYLSEAKGVMLTDLWADIHTLTSTDSERTGYRTQKPESLLERVIASCSNEGDLVTDFFCGSGTTCSVAQRLRRRWFGCDVSGAAVDLARSRISNQVALV